MRMLASTGKSTSVCKFDIDRNISEQDSTHTPCISVSSQSTAPPLDTEELQTIAGTGFHILERSNTYLLKVLVHDRINLTGKDIRHRIHLANQEKSSLGETSNETPSISALLPGCVRIGKDPCSAYAFLSFQDAPSQTAAIPTLSQITYRNQTWKIVPPNKRDLENAHRGQENAKRPRRDVSITESTNPVDLVAPWKGIPYDDQICRKQNHCESILQKICSNIMHWARRDRLQLPAWLVMRQKEGNDCDTLSITPIKNLHCAPFSGVQVSPIIDGYRNRSDFTVGYNEDCTKIIVGFNTGAARDAHFSVFSPKHIPTVSLFAKDIVKRINEWMMQFSPELKPYHKSLQKGFWRRVSVRETQKGETMVTIQTTSDYAQKYPRESIYQSVKETFGHIVTSLQWQEWDGTSNAAPHNQAFVVISGTPTVTEVINSDTNDQYTFLLSPNSFFQVNTKGAELLLQSVRQKAKLTGSTILLDLCCGTGFFSLCFSHSVLWVIGVEMVEAAIEDAKTNASLQNSENVTFICAKIEDCTSALEDGIRAKRALHSEPELVNVVALVDPARGGLHSRIIKWLRGYASIQHLIYVSCHQESLVNDCLGLCKEHTKEYPNEPFTPLHSFAIDMFPHTPHVEQVLIFERK